MLASVMEMVGRYQALTVMCNENHVVRIHYTERYQTIAHDCEKCNQNVVDHVDNIQLFLSHIDPAYKEEDPCQPEESDECGVKGDEEAKWSTDVSPETL